MGLVEIYQCCRCGACSCQGVCDGLPSDWQQNMDGDAFCPPCLAKWPLDAHECEDDMCCYGRTGSGSIS